MMTLRCKSCGRVYSYEKNGTCPKCGAYNRPPRKEIVEPDGTIHYVTTENKACYEEKVCYEEEECYEEEVRHSVSTYSYTPEDPADEAENADDSNILADKLRKTRNDLAASGRKKSVAAVAIVTALISLVTTLIGNIADRRENVSEAPFTFESIEPATQRWNLIAHEESVIHTSSGAVTVNSCRVEGDILHLDLQCDDINCLTITGYYETLTDSGYLEMIEAYSDGDLYTYLASLPEGIDAMDCAVALDIPFEAGVNRYWIWSEQPTYEVGEDFALCGQRLFVSEFRQAGSAADISIDCERDFIDCCEIRPTIVNINGQSYTTYLDSSQCHINYTDGRNTAILNFTLWNKNDTVQSITLLDNETQRQVTINLQ